MPLDREITYVVSGLPRSGTSMMMRMLEAGGLLPVTDGLRAADEDNPRGYYELERAKLIKHDRAWLEDCRGKAVKLITELLRDLPDDRPYKIVFMRRDLEEVLRSQKAMLARRGEPNSMDDGEMRRILMVHVADIEGFLRDRPRTEVLYVSYNRVLADPRGQAARLSAFLGGALDVERLVAAVEPTLYRQRGESPDGTGI